MKLTTFACRGRVSIGKIVGALVVDFPASDPSLPATMLELISRGQDALERARALDPQRAVTWPMADVQLLAPVPNPSKFLAIGGVRALTRQAAVACARKGYGIRVNVVHPCYIRTPLSEAGAIARWGKDKAIQGMKDLHPFQCLGEPDDVAYTVLFLASDESRLINGADIVVDGGLLST